MFEIMLYPLLAMLAISLLAGAYGCQMIWHKLSCLGDALSHGALLGIAAGMLLNLPKTVNFGKSELTTVNFGFILYLR